MTNIPTEFTSVDPVYISAKSPNGTLSLLLLLLIAVVLLFVFWLAYTHLDTVKEYE